MTTQRDDKSNRTVHGMERAGIALFFGLTIATGVLAIPFLVNESISWAEMNGHLLLGTISLAVAVFCHACLTYSFRDASVLFVLSFGISLVAEYAGIHWGVPFGSRYIYHDDLLPRVAGDVPLFIPLAWFVLAYAPLVLLRRFRGDDGRNGGNQRLWTKVLLCSLGLVAADLFLDPLATSVQAWTWAEKGEYFGIPLLNYLGWLLVGFLIYSGFFLLQRPGTIPAVERVFPIDVCFVVSCVCFTVLAQVALWQRLGSALPLVLTMTTMTPFFVYWHVTTRRLLAKPVYEDD